MICFLLWNPSVNCAARHNGRLLAQEAGMRGLGFDALSRAHNLSRLIGAFE